MAKSTPKAATRATAPKKAPKKSSPKAALKAPAKKLGRSVIGIDLGGTKVLAALFDSSGALIAEKKVPTDLADGWNGLRKQLIEICQELCSEYGPAFAVGIGSAGPLHAPSGMLLDPTNFGWPTAKIAIAKELSKALKIPVRLENDAAAAVLAESWKGGAGPDCVVVTLGTGLGVGALVEGKLMRGSRGLHPESGHILLRAGDKSALCACGNYGCSEAFLSGNHFGYRAAARLKMSGISAKQVSEMARNGNVQAKALFNEYGDMLAEFILNLIMVYYPKKVILTGSFADAHDHFLERTEKKLAKLLERRLKTLPTLCPTIQISKLGNRAGVLGAAFVALNEDYAAPAPLK